MKKSSMSAKRMFAVCLLFALFSFSLAVATTNELTYDSNANNITLTYDNVNRVASKTSPTETVTYGYDQIFQGTAGFGTGASGSSGIVFTYYNGQLEFGRYSTTGAGLFTPTASGSGEGGIAPFVNSLEEFEGASFDVNADYGEGATLGLGASLPYNEKTNSLDLKKSSFEVTGSIADANPPILLASAAITASTTKVTPLFKLNFNPKLMTLGNNNQAHKKEAPKTEQKQSIFKTILKKITGKK
ncbi:MAG: hypothetical protein Q8R47_01240 [Nanoarchaeota archaeon]|nr:hypothetical protein [Nanoarchaeota archaeon]